ncbi:DNA-binding response regulator, OmpR family, contains REC and winged-helix (wHTH) domain [Anaerosphaera aminiphila DSM 21120]|uniref:DNA-binding response regulator, OmpR family, contains REC and winged-helix (WHTH) domain n=1 Tax=Anaerosphaera aminiphila DSM 21120 TaxID=1120995 RepID=A0A1M5QFX5_9FIRM|nr:response regulator transcription factor [Anaerosphaera aminiphila]SHH12403.1 DNA-binding response regulator, OmpR family, contains REC and winged-helix (wHTH) domain [Anaerosphaera aminiphila DSM 21120]
MSYNILVCDDEKDIVLAIEIYLKAESYEVFKAYNGLEALKILEEEQIHLVIMDLMMPGMDGISTILKIREQKNIPIIILSAKSEITDKIIGLNVGADDYIVKPFNAIELVARVNSVLRRFTTLGSAEIDKDVYSIGRVTINDSSKEVLVDNVSVSLTPYEYKILLLLIRNKSKVFSSDEIYKEVWEEEAHDVKKVISVHISHLRDKIEINPRKPDLIKSVYGMGYKIEEK